MVKIIFLWKKKEDGQKSSKKKIIEDVKCGKKDKVTWISGTYFRIVGALQITCIKKGSAF